MLRYAKISLFVLLLTVSLVCPVGAQHCPVVGSVGDLSGNCKVGWEDLEIFAGQWLNEGCSAPDCEADLDGVPGVDMSDFSVLADNWLEDYEITLVINEFMAKNDSFNRDPADNDFEDWFEIYNYGTRAIDIGGMYVTDSSNPNPYYWCRIPDDRPAETTVGPGGHLLIWADNEPWQGPLHVNFALGAGGEQIRLYDADENLIDGVIFGPQVGNRSYGRFPNGSDNWLVFYVPDRPPSPGMSNGGQSVDIVINEIMYHPYHLYNWPEDVNPEDIREEYIELFNKGVSLVNLSGWRFSNGVDFAFGNDVTIGSGQYLVVAADVATFTAKYPLVTNVIGGWEGRLSNSGEAIELIDDMDVAIDRVRYADEGDWAVRELGPVDYFHRGWRWSDEHDGGGKSLELVNPALPNEYGQNWAASLDNGGTPGKANSRVTSDVAPLIPDVDHRPIIPGPSDPVMVTADIIDELTSGITVMLHYRVDGAPSFSTVTMFDDGAHGDDDANDGEYGAEIPAHPDGTIIEFYVQATDAGANSSTWPPPSDVDGTPQQVTNLLYQVDDSFDPEGDWVPGSQPVYYIIMTEVERAELSDIGDSDLDDQSGFTSEAMSSAQMNATFISTDGVDTKVRYNVGVRNRGNRNRYSPPMSYRVNFRSDDSWKDVTALNLNSKYPHLQLMGSVLFQMAGVTAANATVVQVRVNGQNLAASDYGRTYNSYIALENYDSDWADNHVPDDGAGNLYRCTYFDNGIDQRTWADLDYKPNMTEYRKNYPKQTNAAQDDYSDLLNLIDILNNPLIPDATFLAEVSQVVDIEQWMRYLAADALAGNREGGLTDGRGDDYAMYRGAIDPRFWLLPHDLDTMLGQGDHDYQPGWNIFNYVERNGGLDGLERLMSQPEVIKLYYNQYEDLIHTVFALENVYPLVDRLLADWVSNSEINGDNHIKDFLTERIDSILYGGYPGSADEPQIPQKFTVNCNLNVVSGFYQSVSSVVSNGNVNGTANAIETSSILVDGQLADWTPRYGTWVLNENIALNPGVNRIIVQAFDGPGGTGKELERGYVDIWYNTGSTNDYPKGGGAQAIDFAAGLSVDLIVRDSYLPNVPVLVRVTVMKDGNSVERDLWDATATLSVDNPSVNLSPSQVTLYNGLGSALVTFTGSGNFTLTADVNGLQTSAGLTDWSGLPINTVSGTLGSSQAWSGIYRITGGDFSIPDGLTLTLNPGTLVLVDGVSSGTTGTDIDVAGSIQSLGSATSPVTFTAYTAGENWGELHHVDAEPSTFQYTNITQAGHSPGVGHSNSGPTIRASNSSFVFDHASLTDNAGKLGHITSGCDLTFRNCLFARSVMGPEMSGTALLFEDGWITDMHAGDDADGIYVGPQQGGQTCVMRRGVSANMVDDGIDLNGADITIEDFIVRDCNDKGISVYGGETNINHCLVVETNRDPEDPTVSGIAAKAHEGATTIVNIDHTTIVTTKTMGVTDYGIQSHNKYGVTTGTIIWDVTNSIIDATDPVNVQAPYLESDVYISYSDVYGETWPGTGNINTGPKFADETSHDYHLQETSPCIDAGDPAAEPDPDLTITDQGYFWFDQGAPNLPEGSLTEDTIWTPEQCPYRITGELTVPFGITLTIMPGTTVYFEPYTRIIIEGRLIAEGTEYELIRFTRTPGSGGTWNGLQFVDAMRDNRITYAVVEYGRTMDGMIGLDDSNLLLDHVTIDNCDRRRVRVGRSPLTDGDGSSLIVRNSTFTNIFELGEAPTGDNVCEHIWGAAPTTGHFIIENNVFGTITGHNDAIDVDGNTRPGPVIQILNNVFLGGGDDALDIEGDAHIEGNVFTHYHKDEFNTGSGNANVISAGGGHDYVVVRNVFYECDHVAQVKSDSFMTFVNNTVADVTVSALYLLRPTSTADYGRGAYVDGSIFRDTELVFDEFTVSTELAINRSIVPSEWHDFGEDNLDADPIFVDPNTDWHLKSMSPAIGTGPCELDMGAYVPGGAAICGEPDEITHHTDATLTVGGPGITDYKYCINNPNGSWSSEQSVNAPINLTGLVDGQSYTVYVVGKNSAGLWQSQGNAAASRTWTVDVSHSKLIINEVLAINDWAINHEGTFPDLIELYYDGPASLDLSDMSISDQPSDPRKYVFGAGVTIEPNEYLVLYADSNTTTSGIHLYFALDGGGEGLYLYDSLAGGGGLLDSVEFGMQINDYSIGRVGYDRQWKLNQPTFGYSNVAQPLGEPATLKINEWLADQDVLFNDDFIELFNPQAFPVDLSGMYLTDNPVTQPYKQQVSPLSFVAGEGFAVFHADDQNRPGHVDFRLSADGEIIALYDAELNEIDKVLYGPQTTDASQGRIPDGAVSFEFFELPTPHIANPVATTVRTTTLVPSGAIARYYVPTDATWETTWMQTDFDDAEWQAGRTGLGFGFGGVSRVAYNDCVYRSSDQYIAANVTTYGIGNRYAGPTSGPLVDQTTGDDTGITATLAQSGGVTWQVEPSGGGSDCAVSTDAYNTFGGITDMTGVIYYGSKDWWVDLTFTGLDPTTGYTFATSATRCNYTNRLTIYTLKSADTYTNASTTGVDVLAENTVRFNTGDNYSEGYVARWTGITAADGSFTVRAEADPSSDSGYKAYSFDVFKLEGGFGGTDVQDDMLGINASLWSRIEFEVEDPCVFDMLTLRMKYEDGFVAYLNGVEVASDNFTGTPGWNSEADGNRQNELALLFVDFDITEHISDLRQGRNVLSIHGLNDNVGDLNFLVLPELVAVSDPNLSLYGKGLMLLDGLRVTEIMYNTPATTSEYDYIELQNVSDVNLDLTGVRFTEGIEFTFPPMELGPGEYVVVDSNSAMFEIAFGTGINVAGEYSLELSNAGENIILKVASPLDAAILRFGYDDVWYPSTDGGGYSLIVLDPTAHPSSWDKAESWDAALPSPGAPNP